MIKNGELIKAIVETIVNNEREITGFKIMENLQVDLYYKDLTCIFAIEPDINVKDIDNYHIEPAIQSLHNEGEND